jgi:hypothetical protein
LVEHSDLAEDVWLAVLVATTTIATLYVGWYVGWRAGRGPRQRATDGSGRADPADPDRLQEAGPGRESIGAWSQRLVAEQARSTRHGGRSTVVALRIGTPSGPLRRRALPDVTRSVEMARFVAGQSRASDVVRATSDGLIRILLVETTEDGARAYIDRLSGGLATDRDTDGPEIVAAWASMAPSRDLSAANRLAVARLRGATSGWLRSLAVHRTDPGAEAPPVGELDGRVARPGEPFQG